MQLNDRVSGKKITCLFYIKYPFSLSSNLSPFSESSKTSHSLSSIDVTPSLSSQTIQPPPLHFSSPPSIFSSYDQTTAPPPKRATAFSATGANAFSEHRQTLLRTSSLTPKKSGRKSSIRMRQQTKKTDLEMEDMVLREAVRIEEELKA
ncbi:uncharacterized protein [Spinacia oleracea]|uniref:Uncharacterized protein isoform X1 n=1 Tax=Spinacia oleracea TaxID=3562 RepID=A0ABM3QHK6_SPIOL|nr:uncharacterized protein LOC130459478 isoform X1 [Spinacia oleracea]